MRFLLLFLLLGCEPQQSPPPLPVHNPAATRVTILLAGDGVGKPLVDRLTKNFNARYPGKAVVVAAPLGQMGAVHSLNDGLIDGALLTLPAGQRPPVPGIALARTEVVVAVGRGAKLGRQLSVDTLVDALVGKRVNWPGGLPRQFLLRGPTDPLEQALMARHPRLRTAFDAAYRTHRWSEFTDPAVLRSSLRSTRGALAVIDVGSLRLYALPVWFSRVGQVDVVIWLLPSRALPPRLSHFAQWSQSPEGQAVIEGLGYAAEGRP